MKEKKINPMGLLLKWANKDRKWIILSVLCGFISGILGIGAYIGIYRLMDALVSGSCNGQVVVDNAILITTTVILRNIFLGTSGVLSHKGAYGALFTVRCMVTEHLSKVPLGALNEKRTGDMKTVLNEDIEKLERGLAHNLPEFVSYFVGPFVIFFYLLSVNVELALISLVPLLFVIGIMVLMFARMMKVMDRASESARNFNSVIIEYIHGMRLIKAYNMGSQSFGKFKAAIDSENDLWNEMSIKTGPLYAAFNIALECGMVFLVPIGGRMFLNSSIPASVFLLFAYVGSMYLTEILPLQQLAMELAQVFAGVGKVKEILDIPVFDGEKPYPDKQDITLEDVTFAYDKEKENVLEHASMSMKQGEKVAIVGKSGAYINILTENVAKYERILTHKMPNLIKNGVIALMIIVFTSILYMPAGLIMLVAAALFIPELMISFQIADTYGGRKAVIYNNTVSSVVNYITGIQTLRAYGMTGVKNEALTRDLKEFSDINYNYEARGIPVSFFFNILQWLTLPAIMIVSRGPWLEGQISGAEFMMLCMVPILLARILMSMAIDIFSFKDMYISKEYIVKLANEKEEVQNDEPFMPDNYTIQFRNVFFSYEEGKEVLSHVNLVIPAGKLTAVVGDSGSGKSTIMNLIGKYYEADQGEIMIGNVNIRDYPSEAVLSRIALVDQDVFLFDDTVRENIRHARPEATDQEIEEACRKADCEEFINAMPQGYDTRIGENGSFLSVGERQRLSIARAILRDSPIILLDEATASLDIGNELKVKRAIQNLLQENKTIVMIAHTLPIIRNADQIVVVDHRTVVEVGTHDSLIQKQGKYFNMWKA